MSVLTDPVRLKQAFVRTYNSRSYADPWDAVNDYHRVQRAAGQNPEKGSAALASVVDLPRGRIRAWINGGAPDPVRGLWTLNRRGWLPDGWDTDAAHGLVVLVGAVYAGGSISGDVFTPRFVSRAGRERAILLQAGAWLGVAFDHLRSEPPEFEPDADAACLGRLLIALGAPSGHKNSQNVAQLPPWLAEAPAAHRLHVAKVYAQFRGVDLADRERTLQIIEQRGSRYRRSLERLFTDVTDSDHVSTGSWPIYIRGEAYSKLRQPLLTP